MYDGINLPRYRSADIDGILLSRRGAVVARRFPKAKVASSTLVGGIPVSYVMSGGLFDVASGTADGEESFLEYLWALGRSVAWNSV